MALNRGRRRTLHGTIQPGQRGENRDARLAREYERRHDGPLRLVAQSVASLSPWAEVVLATCTGDVRTGRMRRLCAHELRSSYREVDE
jgi:hypothetical protein